jgi:hypothetical protein
MATSKRHRSSMIETTKERMIRLAKEGAALPRPTLAQWEASILWMRRPRYYIIPAWETVQLVWSPAPPRV